jgi:tripartite-type tricarboxylate transporter receptor subunit TctC
MVIAALSADQFKAQEFLMMLSGRSKVMRCLIAGAAAALWVGSAGAQDRAASFPSRNITLMVPFGAGGPPDSVARVVANGLSKSLGKPVVVENRPGASTSLAATSVARAAPDGHTLMAVDISFAVTPHIAANLGVNPLKDFKVVGQSARSVFTLIASPSLKTPTLAAFVKLAKEQKEALSIGHTGVGTTPHLAAMTFVNAAKINPLLVPYRTVTEATSNVVAGHIAGVFSAASTAIGLAGDGKATVLGVTGKSRAGILPDVPTFAESGIEMTGFEAGSWYGVVAPAGTPDDVVAKLNAALNHALQDPEVKAKLAATGLELVGSTPREFSDLIVSQHKYWGETLRAAGIMPSDKP